MLKQILKDLYVDPEILAELPEEQKQILFFKMREEQIRRYNEREKEYSKTGFPKNTKNKTTRKMKILEDSNGQPWTWVMGEHPNDIPLEKLWENHGNSNLKTNVEKQQQQDSSPQFSKVQAIIYSRNKENSNNETNKNNSNGRSMAKEEDKQKVFPKPIPAKRTTTSPTSLKTTELVKHETTKPVKQQQNSNVNLVPKPPRKDVKTPLAETKGQSSTDKYEYEVMDETIDIKQLEDKDWENQLRQFKAADERRKLHARRASMEVKRLSIKDDDRGKKLETLRKRFQEKKMKSIRENEQAAKSSDKPALPPKPKNLRPKHPAMKTGMPAKPTNRAEIVEWFQDYQLADILASAEGNKLPTWFHGIISRQIAENLLASRAAGDYLLRVSEKIWGYALSYKDENRMKHFLIDATEPNCYHFFGNDQIRHISLEQLITFHQDEAISYGGEILNGPVGQKDDMKPDYSDLLSATESTNNETLDTAF